MSMYRIETRGRRTFPMVRVRDDIIGRRRVDYGEQSIGVQHGIPGVVPMVRVDRPRLRGEFFPSGRLKARPADPSARFHLMTPAERSLRSHRLARTIRAGR